MYAKAVLRAIVVVLLFDVLVSNENDVWIVERFLNGPFSLNGFRLGLKIFGSSRTKTV